jgi:hypothetical protein
MFVKEMENAEIIKKHWFRRFFLCGCGLKEKTKDPRKLNDFISDLMYPYGNPDGKQVKLLNEYDIIKGEIDKSAQNHFSKTNKLLMQNLQLTNDIYDKMEKGSPENAFETNPNKRVVRLHGSEPKEKQMQFNYSNPVEKIQSRNSDSDESQTDADVSKNICKLIELRNDV